MRSSWCGAAAAVIALSLFGCRPALVKVEGVVTLDGVPVEGAVVSFAPADRTFGAASGVTDVGGMFRLSTREENDGIRPNDYLVTVRKVSGGAPGDTAASRPPRHLLPTVYGTPETTPLRCIVPPNGPVVIELSSRPQK